MLPVRCVVAVNLMVTRDLVYHPGSLGFITYRGSLLWMALRLADILAIEG